jgi:flagellar hook-associated protein 2
LEPLRKCRTIFALTGSDFAKPARTQADCARADNYAATGAFSFTFSYMSSGLQVAGLASNFDWKSFVDQIMDLEHAPADRLAAEKTANTQKVTLLSTLGTKLAALQNSAEALKASALFGKRTATSSVSTSGWGAIAGTDTAIGTYRVAVAQLATSASLNGSANIGQALNPAGSDVSALTMANLPLSQAVTAGTFSINGQQVSVALTDSLQDVFDAISSATSGDITAS